MQEAILCLFSVMLRHLRVKVHKLQGHVSFVRLLIIGSGCYTCFADVLLLLLSALVIPSGYYFGMTTIDILLGASSGTATGMVFPALVNVAEAHVNSTLT